MGFYKIRLGRSRAQIECCHHCDIREVGCHSWCKQYKEERDVVQEENRKARAEYKKEYVQDGMEVRRSVAKQKVYLKRKRG